MTRLRLALYLLVGACMPAFSLAAQQPTPPMQGGPRLESVSAAMRNSVVERTDLRAQARSNSVGRPVALMVVGGAAIILGSVIGSDIGTLFAIGGAIALLYGLYLYLR
jgi:hypothetical protein